jgi:hypothetical protein
MKRENIARFAVVLAALLLPGVLMDLSLHASNQASQIQPIPDEQPRNNGYISPSGRHKVQVTDAAVAAKLASKSGRLIADYGETKLMEVSDSEIEALRAEPNIEFRDEYNVILLNSGGFDTSDEKLESNLENKTGDSGLHLVQFAGPIKP